MKRLTIWAALVALLLAGCSSEEITERHDLSGGNGQKTMSFSMYLPGHTRGYNATQAKISALTREKNVGFSITALSMPSYEPIIDGARFFVNTETSECSSADGTVYTWPDEESEVMFLAHYPANTEMCTLSGMQLSYTPDGKTDIMVDDELSSATTNNGNVSFRFMHILAYAKFNVACSNDVSNASFKLKGLRLKAPKSGTWSFGGGAPGFSTEQTTFSFINSEDEYVDLTTGGTDIDSVMVTPILSGDHDIKHQIIVDYSVTIGSTTKDYSKDASLILDGSYLHQLNIIVSCDKPLTITTNVLPWNDGEVQEIPLSDNNGGGTGTDNHEYVDLGLPSGTLWATCNIGASSPEEYGDYFAWGEVRPKDEYTQENYIYAVNDPYSGNDVAILEDDAAHVQWGGDWRMPTSSQIQELVEHLDEYTTYERVVVNGVNGLKVTSVAYPDRSIFFPMAGMIIGTTNSGIGEWCYYWTRNVAADDVNAGGVNFSYGASWGPGVSDGHYRYSGQPIRPVIPGN